MIKYSFNYIYKLFIEAARDIPKWAPDWIQSHRKFHGYESLEDIPKNFPIKYYRDALPVDDNLVTKLNETIENRRRKEINNFINQISSAIYPIFRKMSRSVTGDNESNEIIERLKSNIMEIEKKIDLYKKDLKLGEEVAAILTKHKDYSSISSEDMEKMFDFYAFNENKPLEENLKDVDILYKKALKAGLNSIYIKNPKTIYEILQDFEY